MKLKQNNMNREIKFRSWDKVLKEWNTSFYINSEGLIYKNGRDLEDGINTFDLELLQDTGLLDRHGKKIYEGGVLSNGNERRCIIFDQGCFQLENTTPDINYQISEEWEIIGNIHKNYENI